MSVMIQDVHLLNVLVHYCGHITMGFIHILLTINFWVLSIFIIYTSISTVDLLYILLSS